MNQIITPNRIALGSLVVLALAFPAVAGAVGWIPVGGNDSVIAFVDRDSIRRNGPKVRAWLKLEWTQPIEVPNSAPPQYYTLQRQLNVFNCQNRTYAIAQDIWYGDAEANEVVQMYSIDDGSLRFFEAAPETIGASILKFICKPTTKKK